MKPKKFKLCIVFFTSMGLIGLNAQESISTTGGNTSGSGGSASYTVGQVSFTTNTDPTGTLSQGVQQPYEIYVITGIGETREIALSVSACPNPVANFLFLKTESEKLQALNYKLFDMNGKLLLFGIIEKNTTEIAVSNLIAANYLLVITQNNYEIKTFKIIKK